MRCFSICVCIYVFEYMSVANVTKGGQWMDGLLLLLLLLFLLCEMCANHAYADDAAGDFITLFPSDFMSLLYPTLFYSLSLAVQVRFTFCFSYPMDHFFLFSLSLSLSLIFSLFLQVLLEERMLRWLLL